ncbi:MAG: hypothetical protein NVSMB2_02050 [Chloroflexota bacterium]
MSALAEVGSASEDLAHFNDEAVISFAEGLVGQPEWRRFVLLSGDETEVVGVLQSVDDEALSLMVTRPTLVLPDYRVPVGAADRAALELEPEQEPIILTTVTVHGQTITTNLMGPLLINPRTRAARQVVLTDSQYTTAYPLGQLGNED